MHDQGHGADRGSGIEKTVQDRRSDVIRQVAEDIAFVGSVAAADLLEIGRENIALQDLDSRVALHSCFELNGQGGVEFDCHHAARALGQKPGHRAPPWTDFDHQVIGADRDRLGDAPAVARVGEEMLAELGPAPELGLETVGHGTTS